MVVHGVCLPLTCRSVGHHRCGHTGHTGVYGSLTERRATPPHTHPPQHCDTIPVLDMRGGTLVASPSAEELQQLKPRRYEGQCRQHATHCETHAPDAKRVTAIRTSHTYIHGASYTGRGVLLCVRARGGRARVFAWRGMVVQGAPWFGRTGGKARHGYPGR